MPFELNKKNVLFRIDKSIKGSRDTAIIPLVDTINAHSDYFTTSSCSGRIVLLETSESFEKIETHWAFVSHDAVHESVWNYAEISKAMHLWFRYEGAILHIACRNLRCAKLFVDLARNTGFKRTGIMSVGEHPIIELTSSESMNAPLILNGSLVVHEQYVQFLVACANGMLLRNHEKITALTRAMQRITEQESSRQK